MHTGMSAVKNLSPNGTEPWQTRRVRVRKAYEVRSTVRRGTGASVDNTDTMRYLVASHLRGVGLQQDFASSRPSVQSALLISRPICPKYY